MTKERMTDPLNNEKDFTNAPCRSFSVPFGNDAAIREAFEEDGYVVVTGVLSDADVGSLVEELWTSPRLLGGKVVRDDLSSWAEGWPQQNGGKNFLNSENPFLDRAPWFLAQHPNIIHTHQQFLGDAVMVHDVGRWGVMRPTQEHPEWRTEANWLHWDQNPWREPGFARVQSFACLTDQTPTSGGLLCVPGFHRRWKSWGEEHPEGSVFTPTGKKVDLNFGARNPFPVPADDPCRADVVRVTAPKGSVVLWDGRLPHQNFPNTDALALRVVHYLHFQKSDAAAAAARNEWLCKRHFVMKAVGEKGSFFPHALSDLGRKVLCYARLRQSEAEREEGDTTGADCTAERESERQCSEGNDGEEGAEDEAKEEEEEEEGERENEELKRAIGMCVESAEAERRGDAEGAARLLRGAAKCYAGIEDWYDAIFIA